MFRGLEDSTGLGMPLLLFLSGLFPWGFSVNMLARFREARGLTLGFVPSWCKTPLEEPAAPYNCPVELLASSNADDCSTQCTSLRDLSTSVSARRRLRVVSPLLGGERVKNRFMP